MDSHVYHLPGMLELGLTCFLCVLGQSLLSYRTVPKRGLKRGDSVPVSS